jgi:hypothetical protein
VLVANSLLAERKRFEEAQREAWQRCGRMLGTGVPRKRQYGSSVLAQLGRNKSGRQLICRQAVVSRFER